MKAKLLAVAALAVVLLAPQAKAVTVSLTATMIGGFPYTNPPQVLPIFGTLEIENGQITSFNIVQFIGPAGHSSWTQEAIAPNLWHLHSEGYRVGLFTSPTIVLCPLGCFLDLIFSTTNPGTLDGYEGGTIQSLSWFVSLLSCPLQRCDPASLTSQFNMIAGTGSLQVIPIPAALPLFATGLGLLGWLGWRRRRA